MPNKPTQIKTMTKQQKSELWEMLHECYAITSVAAHSISLRGRDDGDDELSVCRSIYATLLERSAKTLMQAIAIIDEQM